MILGNKGIDKFEKKALLVIAHTFVVVGSGLPYRSRSDKGAFWTPPSTTLLIQTNTKSNKAVRRTCLGILGICDR